MLIAIFSAVSIFLSAQEKNETEIANRMELFRLAMISADGNSLDELIAEKGLYYAMWRQQIGEKYSSGI